jgi:hypothetical protein
MYLAAADRLPAGGMPRLDPGQPLLRCHFVDHIQKALPDIPAGRTLDPVRIADRTPQHMVAAPRDVQRILGQKLPGAWKPRQNPEAVPAGPRRDQAITLVEQPQVAAERVHQKPCDQRCVVRVRHRLRPDHLDDHAAPVDVARQHHRHPGRAGKPMLARSPAHRFTSAGDPAPSAITRSCARQAAGNSP